MTNAIFLLLQSRKFIVATLAVAGAVLVTLAGVYRGLPESSILGLIGGISGVAWKLIGAIAEEDNAKRIVDGAGNYTVLIDNEANDAQNGGPHGGTKNSN